MTTTEQSRERSVEQLNSIYPPANESLGSLEAAAHTWPDLMSDVEFTESVQTHAYHAETVRSCIEQIANSTESIQSAIESGCLDESKAAELYASLTWFLANEDTQRLLLYLPIEFLPEQDWIPESEELQESIDTFKDQYLATWYNLLSSHEVRANFVDGDILEDDLRTGDLPRVVKAAHLTPFLVKSGLLSFEQAFAIFEQTTDPVLEASMRESLLVLHDLGYTTDSQVQEKIFDTRPTNEVEDAPVTPNRAKWLNEVDHQAMIDELALTLRDQILQNILDPDWIERLFEQENPETVVRALQLIVATKDTEAHSLLIQHLPTIEKLWDTADQATAQHLRQLYRHAYHLGFLPSSILTTRNISVPKLDGPFSRNLDTMGDDVGRIHTAAEAVAGDPLLSASIYPVIALGGSRLKGYGEPTSDLDIAVFIKPGIPEEAHAVLSSRVNIMLAEVGIREEAVEVWLAEEGDNLAVKDMPPSKAVTADSYWTHTLFANAWAGSTEAIQELRQRLLTPYFSDARDNTVHGRADRQLYLERLEQDCLQYRLMHKGYERHLPRTTTIETEHSKDIDGDSVFWDPGFRRLATKLFVDMVYLPKLH